MSPLERTTRIVAASQLSGGIFRTERATERLLDSMAEAAKQGVELLAFPECYLGGYPYWRGNVSVKHETELAARLYEASVSQDSEVVSEIDRHARSLGLSVVVGANERDPRPGAASMFNSAFVFHAERGFVGSHRKLVPTHTERAYWSPGGADDLRVFSLPLGRVGSLICYEHHMLTARLATALLGEEIHCALWPGYWETASHIADKTPGNAPANVEIDAVVRDYAMSSQNFVVSANAYLREADVPADVAPYLGYNLARGGSSVVDASGRYLRAPLVDEEGLVVAEIDFRDRLVTKCYLDSIGHYARWDLFDLTLDGRSLVRPSASPGSAGSAASA